MTDEDVYSKIDDITLSIMLFMFFMMIPYIIIGPLLGFSESTKLVVSAIFGICSVLFCREKLNEYLKNHEESRKTLMSHDLDINKPWDNLEFVPAHKVSGVSNGQEVMVRSYHEDKNIFYINGVEMTNEQTFKLTGTYPVFIYLAQIQNYNAIKEQKHKEIMDKFS